MSALLDLAPEAFVAEMRRRGLVRAWILRDEAAGALRVSHPWLEEVAAVLAAGGCDHDRHEAVLLAAGPATGALFGAFLHRLPRGQAQGGLRHALYPDLAAFLRDGLRLARGMGRKNALAGLWWSGGKGLIARLPGDGPRDPERRRALYREYGDFVSSLRGVYVTAEDAGTTPQDVAAVFERTRFVTCIPPERGGSGNPSPATAAGVVAGIEAALDAAGLGALEGRHVAVQGLGHVGEALVERLLARGAGRVVAAEIRWQRVRELAARWRGEPVEVRHSAPEDVSLLGEPCDVFAPTALGGVLGPDTIPKLQARIVCGAANNPLVDEARDAAALLERGIVYVPDYVVNRMGIVTCANEQYGVLPDDPAILRHLDPDWEQGIPAVVRRVVSTSLARGVPTTAVAAEEADRLAEVPHPLWGLRAREIVWSLARDGWADA